MLHHLDLSKCMLELNRLLRINGSIVFMEPLGTNPLINLYRKLTPNSRTADEHPLTPKDFYFIKTYEFRKKLDPNYSIDGFLYRSIYNQFINSYHKNKSLLKIHDEYVKYLNQIINESSDSDFDRLIKLVEKSINKLPKKCKEIFKLSKTEGLTNHEIATSLNISIKTVEAQITIAFKKIKADVA